MVIQGWLIDCASFFENESAVSPSDFSFKSLMDWNEFSRTFHTLKSKLPSVRRNEKALRSFIEMTLNSQTCGIFLTISSTLESYFLEFWKYLFVRFVSYSQKSVFFVSQSKPLIILHLGKPSMKLSFQLNLHLVTFVPEAIWINLKEIVFQMVFQLFQLFHI